MAKYRRQFNLDVDDVSLIEESLMRRVGELTEDVVDVDASVPRRKDCETVDARMQQLAAIRELLGRIHEQKVWYEPAAFVPRG